MELTPNMAGNTLVAMGIVYLLTLGYSVYMAYLGYKQAKVSTQMQEVITILKEMRDKKE